jgi:hypothetical protein
VAGDKRVKRRLGEKGSVRPSKPGPMGLSLLWERLWHMATQSSWQPLTSRSLTTASRSDADTTKASQQPACQRVSTSVSMAPTPVDGCGSRSQQWDDQSLLHGDGATLRDWLAT